MSKEANEERTPRTVGDVKEMLTKHSNGEIQRTIQNCITILQNDHVLADAIRLNLLSERIDIVKPVGWLRSGKTVVFVTHSIPEAVFLADRVVVMSPRPGRITDIIDVDLPSPREIGLRESPAYFAKVTEVREALPGTPVERANER